MNIEQNISSDFLYQKKVTLPSKYISEFHKFCEAKHKEILNVRIDREKTQLAVQTLSKAIHQYGRKILSVTNQTQGLLPEAIVNENTILFYNCI
jgi:hypothetical protein